MSWRNYIAILAALIAATAAILFALREDSTSDDDTRRDAARPSADLRPQQGTSRDDDTTPTFVRDHRTLDARGDDDGPADRRPADAGDAALPPDASRPAELWADPVNAKVLGRKTWMAPLDDQESERINDIFERARAARVDPRISHRDRRTSIETVRKVVDRCYEDLVRRVPGSRGRLIVAWESGATAASGWVRDVRIGANHGLRDAAFEACILDGAEGLTFPAADGDARTVEYPFFYED